MRINEHTAISTSKLVLVPYSAHHVPQYHEWMKDPEIQTLTASEPLSLDEEFAMQRSWRLDRDKLTFIVCKHAAELPSLAEEEKEKKKQKKTRDGSLDLPTMIGDVNLFVSRVDWDDDAEDHAGVEATVGELELMIAVAHEQRNGYGKAALLAFLRYIRSHEDEILREFFAGGSNEVANGHTTTATGRARRFDYLTVKIGEANTASMGLFEGLRFQKTKEMPNYFGEFELRLAMAESHSQGIFGDNDGLMAGAEYRELEYCCPS